MKLLTAPSFYKLLKDNFPHTPTSKQEVALQQLAHFVLSEKKEEVYLLKGFAGTGKTTIVGAIVSTRGTSVFISMHTVVMTMMVTTRTKTFNFLTSVDRHT